jgi:hypothetical protein
MVGVVGKDPGARDSTVRQSALSLSALVPASDDGTFRGFD